MRTADVLRLFFFVLFANSELLLSLRIFGLCLIDYVAADIQSDDNLKTM